MPNQQIQTKDAPAAIGPYSQGVVSNGFLYTAGQIPLDAATGELCTGDVAAQTEVVMSNLKGVLAAANTTWTDIVKTTVFLKDMSDFAAFNEVYAHWLGDARPARSTVAVAALPRGASVEVEAVVSVSGRGAA